MSDLNIEKYYEDVRKIPSQPPISTIWKNSLEPSRRSIMTSWEPMKAITTNQMDKIWRTIRIKGKNILEINFNKHFRTLANTTTNSLLNKYDHVKILNGFKFRFFMIEHYVPRVTGKSESVCNIQIICYLGKLSELLFLFQDRLKEKYSLLCTSRNNC